MKQAVLGLSACLLLAASAMASPIGQLNVTNCNGGGVQVTGTTITWTPAVAAPAPGAGCLTADTGTNVTYTGGGPLVSGDTTGVIKNLNGSTPSPLANFIVFTDQPILHFDLVSIGPGSNSVACSATVDPNNASCSPFAGSPVILTPNGAGTSATLSARGTAGDSSGVPSNWLGSFTTQFPNITPAQLQDAINNGTTITGFCLAGTCTSTFSGSFVATVNPSVPEPMSLVLIGSGLIGLAFLNKSRKSKV